ncbi:MULTISPECIES: NAD-dependent epimerase/dehydratase family protein [Paracoccus]|jgi:nucleoside-diphosphate-sugar epimerase|uniref:NAD-dependent epimerase/dehydratase family protein n=1 Tax=Paracoccus TaxID=265 RepID=UPI000CEC11F3|nr:MULTISPECIES: NAD(P)-dependent oxidoreductase [Paracoccus]UFS66084.1 NAD(P)-dependent oxidoreductase [Paracoccus denitrificans]
MRIALTGASGLVGRWIHRAAVQAGHQVTTLPGWRLGAVPGLTGCDALIHAAFQHAPGRYRGGEGADPEGFIRANLDGSLMLFRAARDQGVGRVIFLSSRAVHDGHPEGMALPDELSPLPTSLYGRVKADAEAALAAMSGPGFLTASLRPTGVYGPGLPQKWAGLIGDFLHGITPAPRVATELHGADLAQAVLLVLADPAMAGSYNASDLVLDRSDLLAEVARLTDCATPLPAPADAGALRRPLCARLQALGWRPGGMARLRRDLPEILGDLQP